MKKAPLKQNYCRDHKNKNMCLALKNGFLLIEEEKKKKNFLYAKEQEECLELL